MCVFIHSADQKGSKAGDHENQSKHASKQLKEFQKEMNISKDAAKFAQEDGEVGKGGGDEGLKKNGRDVFCDGSSDHTSAGTREGKNKGDEDKGDGNDKLINIRGDEDKINTADGDGDKKKKRLRDGPLVPETVTGKTFYSIVCTE